MAGEKPDVLLVGNKKPVMIKGLDGKVTLHALIDATDKDAFLKSVADKVRAIVIAYTADKVDGAFMGRFPKLEQISSFGVGYDHIDAKWAGEHGIIVTNTPEVLNEEVADTALGLLLCTVREFPQSDRYLRAGKWTQGAIPAHQGDLAQPHRRHGRHGPHRQGDRQAARRLRRAGGLSLAQPASRRRLQVLSQASRHGARRRHADGDRAGRAGDQEHDQRRGAQGARPQRHPHQHGARLGGRRAGLDRRLEEPHHLFRRPRRLRQGAASAARAASTWTTSCCSRISAPRPR